MSYEAKVVLDSISAAGHRVTTMEVTFPRIILAEYNTHRVLSRNSASSRAIPVEKMLKRCLDDPFVPEYWGVNQKGMQAEAELSGIAKYDAKLEWSDARYSAIDHARTMLEIGVHKQITNRLLEPWLFQTVITTATEWDNLRNLRTDKAAQPEFRKAAELMFAAYDSSTPTEVPGGGWHLPLVTGNDWGRLEDEGYDEMSKAYISAGRCARVSYLTHNGERSPSADYELATKLMSNGHMSPLEHPCRPMTESEYDYTARPGYRVVDDEIRPDASLPSTHFLGNVQGWVQLRKLQPNESVYTK